jgi:hypothetical protein
VLTRPICNCAAQPDASLIQLAIGLALWALGSDREGKETMRIRCRGGKRVGFFASIWLYILRLFRVHFYLWE